MEPGAPALTFGAEAVHSAALGSEGPDCLGSALGAVMRGLSRTTHIRTTLYVLMTHKVPGSLRDPPVNCLLSSQLPCQEGTTTASFYEEMEALPEKPAVSLLQSGPGGQVLNNCAIISQVYLGTLGKILPEVLQGHSSFLITLRCRLPFSLPLRSTQGSGPRLSEERRHHHSDNYGMSVHMFCVLKTSPA